MCLRNQKELFGAGAMNKEERLVPGREEEGQRLSHTMLSACSGVLSNFPEVARLLSD